MLDKETYLNELTRYFDSVRDDDYKDEIEEPTCCIGVSCTDCIFNKGTSRHCIYTLKHIFDALEELEKWSKEHPPKKFKVSKLEFDILEIYYVRDREWHIYEILEDEFLSALFKEGYFKGATRNMTIEKYLRNCEVVDDESI